MADLIYVNGDSWTYGSELADRSHAWPYVLGKSAGFRVDNQAEPGSTNDSILRRTVRDCLELQRQGVKPFVVVAWTHLHRFELPIASSGGSNYYNFVNPNDPDLPTVGREIWQHWSSDRSDVDRWLQQLHLLSAFLDKLKFDHRFFLTYDRIARLSQAQRSLTEFKLELKPFDLLVADQPKGTHGHPLELAQAQLAEFVRTKITGRRWAE